MSCAIRERSSSARFGHVLNLVVRTRKMPERRRQTKVVLFTYCTESERVGVLCGVTKIGPVVEIS